MEWFLFFCRYRNTIKHQDHDQINSDAPGTACQYL